MAGSYRSRQEEMSLEQIAGSESKPEKTTEFAESGLFPPPAVKPNLSLAAVRGRPQLALVVLPAEHSSDRPCHIS
jgi:hypothetical protein